METLFKNMPPESKEGVKHYMASKEIPQLFECITTGMLHHRPENTVVFVQECINEVREKPPGFLRWNTFIDWKPSDEAMKTPSPSRENSARRLLRSSAASEPSLNSSSLKTPVPAGTDTDSTTVTQGQDQSQGQIQNEGHSPKVQLASASSVRASSNSAAVESFP